MECTLMVMCCTKYTYIAVYVLFIYCNYLTSIIELNLCHSELYLYKPSCLNHVEMVMGTQNCARKEYPNSPSHF